MFIKQASTYEEIYNSFSWAIPEFCNIATLVCDRHAAANGCALIHEGRNGVRYWTFGEIQRAANQLANLLGSLGLRPRDRLAILLGQDPEAPISHIGAWKSGMISVTMSRLFGPDALLHRLNDSGALALVTDRQSYQNIYPIRERLPNLKHVLLVDGPEEGAIDFWATLDRASASFATINTRASDPAYINYTSGTTGLPKGVLKPHGAMIGQMPAIEFIHDFYPQENDLFWSPADWSWLAGLMGVLFPAWFYAKPVLAFRANGFDAEQALHMMAKHKVRNSMLTPTMLKQMRQIPSPRERFDLCLRSIVSGSEAVGVELMSWSQEALGLGIHIAFGQTECNAMIGNSSRVMPIKPAALGRAMPGHKVAIIGDDGSELRPGEIGNIGFHRPDPIMMVEYWKNPVATQEKFRGDWLLTGDLGWQDEDGYFWFHSRADDVISSAGYRIGPAEIEDTLLTHSAVAMAGAIGVPDAQRGEIIKAFIVLRSGVEPASKLADEIRLYVRNRLAKHEAPREIEFVDQLPLTPTGKIMRRELRNRELQKRTRSQAAGLLGPSHPEA